MVQTSSIRLQKGSGCSGDSMMHQPGRGTRAGFKGSISGASGKVGNTIKYGPDKIRSTDSCLREWNALYLSVSL